MEKLISLRITEPWQVEIMRTIYNDNLDMLATMPIPYRTYEDQQNWWKQNNKILKAFLYKKAESPDSFVAFLVLSDRGGFYTPIMAIKKEEWGKGLAKEIIPDYIEKAGGPLAGSQLQSNGAICHLNKINGWQIVDKIDQPTGAIDLLYHPGINPNVPDREVIYLEIIEYLKNKYKPEY